MALAVTVLGDALLEDPARVDKIDVLHRSALAKELGAWGKLADRAGVGEDVFYILRRQPPGDQATDDRRQRGVLIEHINRHCPPIQPPSDPVAQRAGRGYSCSLRTCAVRRFIPGTASNSSNVA